MSGLPSGTVTFLFTDIEGSTRLSEQHPQLMRQAQARHDALLREVIAVHEGHIFRPAGDGFCAVFAGAPQAVAAAVAAQRGLHAERWGEIGSLRVRMAVHTGLAELRDGDYFGLPLNRVARLREAAHGGQVVLSQVTAGLAHDSLPEGVTLRDLGEHRLRDLTRPERVYQLVITALLAEFAPLKTLETRPNNLPVQRSLLIGREQEIASIQRLLLREDVGLVTLTGPGGTGKTRLSLQVAAEILDQFEDGVFFVPLAPISDPALVIPTIATHLGLRDAGGRPLHELLKEFLREKRLLLVLDNFEQVLDAAPAVTGLMATCPHLKILVTSRAVLRLYGEHDFPVPPLALPEMSAHSGVEELRQSEAILLFVERAQAARPDFALTPENTPAVTEICHRLDGLPLAIELAAARIRLLPPQAMLARMSGESGSLQLLTGGARDLPQRQQTLRSTIDWSYRLLDEAEQAVFRRLGVFVGGCSLEAVEAVCGDVLDAIESLVDKSLVRQEENARGEPRFRMYEMVREFALEQLTAGGEEEVVRQAHANYFLALAEQVEPKLASAEQQEWLDRLEAEHDNLRQALRWLLDREHAELALQLSGALWRFWYTRGYLSEGRRWLEEVLGATREPLGESWAASRAKALNGAGVLAHYQGDLSQSATLSGESLRLYRRLDDKRGIAAALHGLAIVSRSGGDYASARAMYEEAVVLLREIGDTWGTAYALFYLGIVFWNRGDYDDARTHVEEALALAYQLHDRQGISIGLTVLGYIAHSQGDDVTADKLCGEALPMARELGLPRPLAQVLWGVGNAALGLGDYARARARFEESIAGFKELGDKSFIGVCLDGLAGVALAQGQPRWAARFLGIVDSLLERMGVPRAVSRRAEYERNKAAARAALGETAFTAAREEGRKMTLEQALAQWKTIGGEEVNGAGPGQPSMLPPPVNGNGNGGNGHGNGLAVLTRREQEVAALIAQGLTNRQIAAELVIAEGTADRHVSNILGKLGLATRAQVAAWVVEHGPRGKTSVGM